MTKPLPQAALTVKPTTATHKCLKQMENMSSMQKSVNDQGMQLALGQMAPSLKASIISRMLGQQRDIQNSLKQVMNEISKFIALKNYIPVGLPTVDDFIIKEKEVNFSGIGLHSGIMAKVTLEPANSNSGIVFRRTDLEKDNEIVANFKNVSSAKLCTKIENSSGVSVSTIEHLMAAFYICGIDNIIVNLNGPEVPIMDGSAKDFVKIIKDCGLKVLEGKRKFVRIKNKIELKTEDGKIIYIKPSNQTLDVKFTLNYEKNPLIKTQKSRQK